MLGRPDFRLIAAMNPFDAIGTARVSQAIADRMCRVVLGYQDDAAERAISAVPAAWTAPLSTSPSALVRATREHRDLRMGSSVRGAIDLALVLTGLAGCAARRPVRRETARDAAHAALSGRIRIADGVDRTPESVLDELLDLLWPAEEPDPPTSRRQTPGKS